MSETKEYVKPTLVDKEYLWDHFRIGRGKLNQLVEDGEVAVIRSWSRSRHIATRKTAGKIANRPKNYYVLKSVEDYLLRCAARDGVTLDLD